MSRMLLHAICARACAQKMVLSCVLKDTHNCVNLGMFTKACNMTNSVFNLPFDKLLFKPPNHVVCNPVPLSDLYFDSFSYPVASIFFGDMAIVSLFLLLFFKPIPDPVWNPTARFLCSVFYYGGHFGHSEMK